MNKNELARYIDQTTLKPGMTEEFITEFCQKARENQFASVCILPNMIETAAKVLKGSDTKVCTVISFPLGFDWPDVKIYETKEMCIRDSCKSLYDFLILKAIRIYRHRPTPLSIHS